MRIIYLVLVILFALFIVTFSQQNLMPVKLEYYNLLNIPPVPTYLLIFVSLLMGVIITGFWGIVERFRLNRTIRRLNKIVRDLRKELHANEAPPIITLRCLKISNLLPMHLWEGWPSGCVFWVTILLYFPDKLVEKCCVLLQRKTELFLPEDRI